MRGFRNDELFAVIPANAGMTKHLKGLLLMDKQPCVYILANRRNGTLYIGVTSNLIKRVWQHKNNFVEGFTRQYGIHLLVWYELHETMLNAIEREKILKKWRRQWKLDLIEQNNPDWRDLYEDLI